MLYFTKAQIFLKYLYIRNSIMYYTYLVQMEILAVKLLGLANWTFVKDIYIIIYYK